MTIMSIVRSLGARLGGKRNAQQADAATQRARYFVGVGGRPMRVTISEASSATLDDAIEDGELPIRKASGALQLRGVARVDGHLITLHDIDPLREPQTRSEERPTVSS